MSVDNYGGIMILELNQEDIDEGLRSCPTQCAVARALKRAGFKHAGASLDWVQIIYGRYTKRYKISRALKKFIHDFDNKKPVKPSRFRIAGLKRPGK